MSTLTFAEAIAELNASQKKLSKLWERIRENSHFIAGEEPDENMGSLLKEYDSVAQRRRDLTVELRTANSREFMGNQTMAVFLARREIDEAKKRVYWQLAYLTRPEAESHQSDHGLKPNVGHAWCEQQANELREKLEAQKAALSEFNWTRKLTSAVLADI